MKQYAVLKISVEHVDSFLNSNAPAALMLDSTFETLNEAQEHVRIMRKISSWHYFVWFLTEPELVMFLDKEEEL